MIINCPKCSFSQPKDRYCANCGVDMEAYRPKEVPLSSRIAKNWMFQAAILVVAIATGLSFLRVQPDRETEDFADLARPLPQQTTLEAPPPPLDESAADNSAAVVTPPPLPAQQAPPPPPAPNARALAPAGQALPATPARATRARVGEANRDSVFTQIDLVYAEVPASVIGNMEESSRMLESENVTAGVYPNIAPVMRQLTASGAQQVRALRVLESARNLSVRINQPIISFKGTRAPGLDRNVGLTTQIIPTAMDENGLHFQIDIQTTLRDPASASGVQETSYRAEISLTKGAGAFIYGLIPRRSTLTDRDRAAYADAGVLKIMASPEFQQNLSEFVLFIEAR